MNRAPVLFLAVCVGLTALPALALVGPPEPSIWERLGRYRTTYLRSWSDALDQEPASPIEVIDAFLEVATAVSGPGGFWRRTVPTQWLGCEREDAAVPSEPCQRLAASAVELRKWDRLRRRMARLSPSAAARFLSTHRTRLLAYLDTYVPDAPTASDMERTPFFARTLGDVIP